MTRDEDVRNERTYLGDFHGEALWTDDPRIAAAFQYLYRELEYTRKTHEGDLRVLRGGER